jgi:two-component system, LytTR family, response regulator
MKQFLIPTSKGTKEVMQENIIRVEASSNYCKIFFIGERPLVVAKLLHWFEEKLPKEMFCRIHRGHIVNRMYVEEITGSSVVKLLNGDMLQISRRRKNQSGKVLRQTA